MTQNKGKQGTGKQSVPCSSLSDSTDVLAALLGGLSLMQANTIVMAMLTATNQDVCDNDSQDVKPLMSLLNASTPAATLVTPGGVRTSAPTLPMPIVPPPPHLPPDIVTPVASAPAVAAVPPAPVPGQPLPFGWAFYVTPPILEGPFYVVIQGHHVSIFSGWGNISL
ncbi:hypothetical protein ARMGADRAFT_1075264 [Armillaria gallica]|uniref:Uncharacterized protein n=1 Tax=Armillaria gallica TaxID=47427 RepID=A0A2H3E5J4_ARMGA|nr:hypothetical protein ARMGADRAFT_1075264 [Armillaria gallica]